MSCPVSTSCSYQKPTELLLREAFAKNADGCIVIRTQTSEDVSTDCEALTCAEQAMSWQELFATLFTTNEDGCTVLNIAVT
jgi:hypothetical protein